MADVVTSLRLVEELIWTFIGVPLIICLTLYLSIKSRFVQIRGLPKVFRTFSSFLRVRELDVGAIHPLKAFFASVGGSVGIGNIVAVCTAIQIGGPGALFWVWVTATIGVMLKYAEVYLGMKYRVPDGHGGYNGGPMYYLKKAFSGSFAPTAVALLLCFYGIEIYQFNIITNSVATNFHISEWYPVLVLLALVLFAGSGGVRRVGAISSAIVPFFVIVYTGMVLWVIGNNIGMLPSVFYGVFVDAFTGTAAFGGFAGSALMLTISQGVRRGCYSGDIGIGYASVIYSESSEHHMEKQASLVLMGVIIDTFIVCTSSILLILVTGVWAEPMSSSMLVQSALSKYFPYMHVFMPLFFFLLGYSTLNPYFVVGLKCSGFLLPKWGPLVYSSVGATTLVIFSFVDQREAQSVMMIISGLLLILNSWGVWRLRHEISYNI